MKTGTEDKRKLMIAGVAGFFALLMLYPLYQELFGGPSPVPAAPTVVVTNSSGVAGTQETAAGRVGGVRGAQKVGTASTLLDPTLHMEAMRVTESLVYTGSGRNIFAAGPTEAEIVAKAAARPIVIPVALQGARPVTGPLPPPPINLKFFGTATTSDGLKRAFLLNGEDVFLASAGDVVQRRYRVVSIAATSILIEDLPNSNRQTLPLIPN